jgi:hypothetical protein
MVRHSLEVQDLGLVYGRVESLHCTAAQEGAASRPRVTYFSDSTKAFFYYALRHSTQSFTNINHQSLKVRIH